jgi:hypothetical protein
VRGTALLGLAALAFVATACGDERPGEMSPAPSAASSPSAPSPSSTAPAPTGALDGFPLALGYDDRNGDDGSLVRVTTGAASAAFSLCGTPTWDPRAGATDVIGVEWRAEAEWARGRTLVLYPDTQTAAAAVSTARDAVSGCSEEPAEPGYGSTHTLLDVALGDESVVWADTYWFSSDDEKLHGTGLTVYHLVRVGPAVLLAYEYGEGNGSEESRVDTIARATRLERPIVAAMGDLERTAP